MISKDKYSQLRNYFFFVRFAKTCFFFILANGLPDRHVWYVYLQARKICHPHRRSLSEYRKYTLEETKTILSMKNFHNETYAAIATALNRSSQSVYDRFLRITGRAAGLRKEGAFDEVEMLKLLCKFFSCFFIICRSVFIK